MPRSKKGRSKSRTRLEEIKATARRLYRAGVINSPLLSRSSQSSQSPQSPQSPPSPEWKYKNERERFLDQQKHTAGAAGNRSDPEHAYADRLERERLARARQDEFDRQRGERRQLRQQVKKSNELLLYQNEVSKITKRWTASSIEYWEWVERDRPEEQLWGGVSLKQRDHRDFMRLFIDMYTIDGADYHIPGWLLPEGAENIEHMLRMIDDMNMYYLRYFTELLFMQALFMYGNQSEIKLNFLLRKAKWEPKKRTAAELVLNERIDELIEEFAEDEVPVREEYRFQGTRYKYMGLGESGYVGSIDSFDNYGGVLLRVKTREGGTELTRFTLFEILKNLGTKEHFINLPSEIRSGEKNIESIRELLGDKYTYYDQSAAAAAPEEWQDWFADVDDDMLPFLSVAEKPDEPLDIFDISESEEDFKEESVGNQLQRVKLLF